MLRAAGDPTRLRLLLLLRQDELTVSELIEIVGQSQPRVSRHLKLLCDAGLLDRFREGTWAFYRLGERSAFAGLARTLIDAIPADDPTLALDLERLNAIKRARAEAAAEYFRENAARWHEIRSLHVPERDVEAALLELLPASGIQDLLDLGTGTGRMLELFAPRAQRAIGIDVSPDMLAIARDRLLRENIPNAQVRLGDTYRLPFPNGAVGAGFDVVLFHQVLHYLDDPGTAVAEAARVMAPGGKLLIADFASHNEEFLREEYAHRRLGFSDREVEGWFAAAGLTGTGTETIASKSESEKLTVKLWLATAKPKTKKEAA